MDNDDEIEFILPGYPQYPASLSTAMTFYNAARNEINERAKFRDQVLLTVIGATFAFLGFMKVLDMGPTNIINPGEHILLVNEFIKYFITIGGGSVLVYFLAIYNGYQNSKIAELGLFITSGPAKHLMLYGAHELADKIRHGKNGEFLAEEIKDAHIKLKNTIAHWDGWAAQQLFNSGQEAVPFERDQHINEWDFIDKYKDQFSQDRLYKSLLLFMSSIPSVITISFLLYGDGAIISSFKKFVTYADSDKFCFYLDGLIYFIFALMALLISIGLPAVVRNKVTVAKNLKDKYSKLRKSYN